MGPTPAAVHRVVWPPSGHSGHVDTGQTPPVRGVSVGRSLLACSQPATIMVCGPQILGFVWRALGRPLADTAACPLPGNGGGFTLTNRDGPFVQGPGMQEIGPLSGGAGAVGALAAPLQPTTLGRQWVSSAGTQLLQLGAFP